MKRRAFLKSAGSLAVATRFPVSFARADDENDVFTKSDEVFLEELERACFQFFWESTEPTTGLSPDRAHADGSNKPDIASIASTGFGLSALCIAHKRGWQNADEITARVQVTLHFLRDKMPHKNGFFYHFVDIKSGERVWKSEISTIDTAILLCGVLACRGYFDNVEIRALADDIYARVDWPWLTDGLLIRHGWKPQSGFLKYHWGAYSELMMIYLLAIGAPEKAIDAQAWHAWQRPWFDYEGLHYINGNAPLFIHQYSHAWFDFRGRRDAYTNYFENSILATKAHRAFCVNLQKRFAHFGPQAWGITASDSQKGYVAWGGPPEMGKLDGTLVPCAASGSLPFLPSECVACLRNLREKYPRAWQHYGFVDAFNPQSGWYDADVIGIDIGITLLMAENVRSSFVWEIFMRNETMQNAMKKAGFE